MKEIEVKAKVDNFDYLISRLNDLGCVLSEPLIQKDIIFLEGVVDVLKLQPGRKAFRIREENGKFTFNLKMPQGGQLDCIEKESVIEIGELMWP